MKRNILFVTSLLVTMSLAGCGNASEEKVDNEIVEDIKTVEELPTEAGESLIAVNPVEIPHEFIIGADVSSVLAEEESGVKFYNEKGEETDLFKILADNGFNSVRVRVWNNPFDEDKNGYGGGNCDVNTACIIGKRAADYGMSLCVDFHYSDFWADPKKQMCPKAWQGMSLDEKKTALYEFTAEALDKIAKEGANIKYVQLGNEVNYGMAGETNHLDVIELQKEGAKAVREFSEKNGSDTKIIIHYTNIDDPKATYERAENLAKAELDYDIFGVSYYPFWHGGMQDMEEVLSKIKTEYKKDTCIMETSYIYTNADGDESGNSVDASAAVTGYPANEQGQANAIRDVIDYAVKAGSLGVYYWEPAWIPVGSSKASNSSIWEEHGSGWASSYAGSYDSEDAGKYYGGSSWDNQALFDKDGKVLASMDVFKYLRVGTTTPMPEGDEYKPKSTEVDLTTIDGKTNYVLNPSFETGVTEPWFVIAESKDPSDIQEKSADAFSGKYAFHFWDNADEKFMLTQIAETLPEGTYTLSCQVQGGDIKDGAEIYLYANSGAKEYRSENIVLDGWVNWKNPTITGIEISEGDALCYGLVVNCAAGGWGTADDFVLIEE